MLRSAIRDLEHQVPTSIKEDRDGFALPLSDTE